MSYQGHKDNRLPEFLTQKFIYQIKSLWLRLNYYTLKIGGHRKQWISHKVNMWHPGQLKQNKSWGPFWSFQLNSKANLANVAHYVGKWVGLTVLSSW
jgi:hypothetical protein